MTRSSRCALVLHGTLRSLPSDGLISLPFHFPQSCQLNHGVSFPLAKK